jgi:peptidoglycan/LPS O-acetylase OafA/YrhL
VPFRSDTVPLSPQFVQLWTIWVEFQFYLIFPFLLAFSRRFGARYLWGLLALLMLTRALVFMATGSVRFIAYETIFGRLDQFLLGMLMGRAWLARNAKDVSAGADAARGLSPVWLLLAGVVVILSLQVFSLKVGFSRLDSAFWIVWPEVEAAMWCGFVWAYLRARWAGPVAPRRAIDKALASLGAISFSIYVMHNLVISAFNARLPVLPVMDFVPGVWGPTANVIATGAFVVLPMVVAVSAVTYNLIERPFLAMRAPYLVAS